MVGEGSRNEIVRSFVWDHVLGKACFPLSQPMELRSQVFALLSSNLGGLGDAMNQTIVRD